MDRPTSQPRIARYPVRSIAATRATMRGFSLLESIVVMTMALVLTATSLPAVVNAARTYKLSGSARTIAAQLALVRLRAAGEFTQTRLNGNTTAGTYQIEVCTTKNTSTGGCTTFTTEGGTQYLPAGISFGFGSLTTPAGAQTAIAQSFPMLFNSRGIPVDSSLNPTGNDAVYLTNGSGQYYAVTMTASGRTAVWSWTGSTWQRM